MITAAGKVCTFVSVCGEWKDTHIVLKMGRMVPRSCLTH